MKPTDRQTIPVPKLSGDTKAMNGKSSRRLMQCIDNLCQMIDEPKDEPHEAAQDRPISPPDAE